MSRPPKPTNVLKLEKKSHRTKKELKQREDGEKALASGLALKERSSVKNNPVAHKEFKRLVDLLRNIEKNDAIYEPIINRYCLIQAECEDLETRREYFYNLINKLENTFNELEEVNTTEMLEFTKEISRLVSGMINIDKVLQSKRKMLLDIEKENIMTIAAALRSIPKKEEKTSNMLLEALSDA